MCGYTTKESKCMFSSKLILSHRCCIYKYIPCFPLYPIDTKSKDIKSLFLINLFASNKVYTMYQYGCRCHNGDSKKLKIKPENNKCFRHHHGEDPWMYHTMSPKTIN